MFCYHDKKEFRLSGNIKEFKMVVLDDSIFGTVISFPVNDDDIAEMMWEQVCLNNPISEKEKDLLIPLLIEFYHSHKQEYSNPQSECSGCRDNNGCC